MAVSNKASIEERGLATAEEISTFTDLPVLDSDDDFYDSEELDDEEPFLVQRTAIIRLGDFFCQSWEHRRTSIVNDIVVSAWFLSPVQSIREDVRAAMETEEYPKLVEALERYAVKMKLPLGSVNPAEHNDKKDELLATLHTELRQFQDKTGPYSRDYIWKACEIERGESHLWHRQYSLGTKVLGSLGMRACSKIVGIGSAERTWARMKEIQGLKRKHLSPEKSSKQATLSGRYMSEKATVAEAHRVKSRNFTMDLNDDDYIRAGLSRWKIDMDAQQRASKPGGKVFRAYSEPFELSKKEDVEVHNKMLKKYGGLRFQDDDGKVKTIDDSELQFCTLRNQRGYLLVALFPEFDPTAPDYDRHSETWKPCNHLWGGIYDYYRANPDPSVFILTKDEDLDEDKNWIYEMPESAKPQSRSKSKKRRR